MDKPKYTPGPYKLNILEHGYEILAKDGPVATTYTNRAIKDRSNEEVDANAHLLGAAPDLLDALKEALPSLATAEYRLRVNDWAEGDPKQCDTGEEHAAAMRAYKLTLKCLQTAIKKATNAIDKAEGRQ